MLESRRRIKTATLAGVTGPLCHYLCAICHGLGHRRDRHGEECHKGDCRLHGAMTGQSGSGEQRGLGTGIRGLCDSEQ